MKIMKIIIYFATDQFYIGCDRTRQGVKKNYSIEMDWTTVFQNLIALPQEIEGGIVFDDETIAIISIIKLHLTSSVSSPLS
jgi:hypothetical protein